LQSWAETFYHDLKRFGNEKSGANPSSIELNGNVYKNRITLSKYSEKGNKKIT